MEAFGLAGKRKEIYTLKGKGSDDSQSRAEQQGKRRPLRIKLFASVVRKGGKSLTGNLKEGEREHEVRERGSAVKIRKNAIVAATQGRKADKERREKKATPATKKHRRGCQATTSLRSRRKGQLKEEGPPRGGPERHKMGRQPASEGRPIMS